MFQNLQNMRPLGQLFSMLPGFGGGLITKGKEKEGQAKIKRYMTIMDSMTDAELDSTNPKLMNESRIIRVARGSGSIVEDVKDMLEEYKRIAKMWSKLKLNNKNARDHQIINALPPNLLKQIGGAAGLQTVTKQMCSKGGELI